MIYFAFLVMIYFTVNVQTEMINIIQHHTFSSIPIIVKQASTKCLSDAQYLELLLHSVSVPYLAFIDVWNRIVLLLDG